MTDFTVTKIGKRTYRVYPITLAQIGIDDLVSDGKISQNKILELAVRDENGAPIPVEDIPIGHALKLVKPAMEASGFETEELETGNA